MRKGSRLPMVYNAGRRLYAAVILQAVYDLTGPAESYHISDEDRASAQAFLAREADIIVAEFDISPDRLQKLLAAGGGGGW